MLSRWHVGLCRALRCVRPVCSWNQRCGRRSLSCSSAMHKQPAWKKSGVLAEFQSTGAERVDWEPDQLVERVYDESETSQRMFFIEVHEAAAVFHQLREYGASEQQVWQLVTTAPSLLRRGCSFWRRLLDALLDEGMSLEQTLAALSECPPLLDCGPTQLHDAMGVLCRRLTVVEPEVHDMLVRRPFVLCRSVKQLTGQLTELARFFSADQTTRVAIRCPLVLVETPLQTRSKIDYLNHRMGLTTADIAHSAAMDHPLAHVRARHMVLTRLGRYVPPNEKDKSPSTNPALTSIVADSDEQFCLAIARIRYSDYEIFTRLLDEEIEEEIEESDVDEDSDDEPSGYLTSRKR